MTVNSGKSINSKGKGFTKRLAPGSWRDNLPDPFHSAKEVERTVRQYRAGTEGGSSEEVEEVRKFRQKRSKAKVYNQSLTTGQSVSSAFPTALPQWAIRRSPNCKASLSGRRALRALSQSAAVVCMSPAAGAAPG